MELETWQHLTVSLPWIPCLALSWFFLPLTDGSRCIFFMVPMPALNCWYSPGVRGLSHSVIPFLGNATPSHDLAPVNRGVHSLPPALTSQFLTWFQIPTFTSGSTIWEPIFTTITSTPAIIVNEWIHLGCSEPPQTNVPQTEVMDFPPTYFFIFPLGSITIASVLVSHPSLTTNHIELSSRTSPNTTKCFRTPCIRRVSLALPV